MFTLFLQVTARELGPRFLDSSNVYSHTCFRLAELSVSEKIDCLRDSCILIFTVCILLCIMIDGIWPSTQQ
jgi:hypothetical protein